MSIIRSISITALCFLLAACAAAYRIDIQQGNVVTDTEVQQLEPGMTKREVRYVLGTPLVVDPFHENRWDYFYSMDRRGKDVVQRRITIVFENDVMDRIEGDLVENTVTIKVDEEQGGTVVTESQRKEKGFFARTWDKIWDKGDEVY